MSNLVKDSVVSVRVSVAAVVVTYNRLEKLKKVIDAIKAQTHPPAQVYVVDNASTDGTGPWLTALEAEDPRFQHVRLAENIGGAGGFHEGMRVAYDNGHDYVWISDDDAYPEPNAIEQLLFAIRDFETRFTWRPSFACSAVNWTDGTLCEMNTPTTVWDWPRFFSAETPYFLVNSCSFVSVLVPRWAIQKHGFPIKDYFIWFDDAEFTQRIARSYPGIYVPASVVVHDVPENKGVNFALVTEGNVWKFRYGARNEASFARREKGWLGVAHFAYSVRRRMLDGNVAPALRRDIYKAIWKGCFFTPEIVRPDHDAGL